jgi:hypothetical protein
MLSRQLSLSQKRRKTELVDSTRLHTEPWERTAANCQYLATRVGSRASYIVHRQWSQAITESHQRAVWNWHWKQWLRGWRNCFGYPPSRTASAEAAPVAENTLDGVLDGIQDSVEKLRQSAGLVESSKQVVVIRGSQRAGGMARRQQMV